MGWFDSQRPPQQAGGIGGAIGQAFQQQQPGSLASLGGGLNTPQPVPGMPPRQMPQQPPMTGIDWDQHQVGTRPGEPGFDQNAGFNQILYPGGQLPPGWQPNTGGINPNQPQGGASLSDQDYTNTINRMRELQQDDWRYPTPIQGPNLNDPRRNEMNVLQQRLMQGSGNRNWQQALYPNTGRSFNDLIAGNRGSGQPINQPMTTVGADPTRAWSAGGSLQSLGLNPQSVQRAAMGAGQIGQMINLRGPDGSTKAVPADQAQHWLSKGAVRF